MHKLQKVIKSVDNDESLEAKQLICTDTEVTYVEVNADITVPSVMKQTAPS